MTSNLTLQEQAVLNFYQWDYKLRGYWLFDEVVDIEPPYVPFQHINPSSGVEVDDGRVPSIWKKAQLLFSNQKEPKEEAPEVFPISTTPEMPRTAYRITFPHGQIIGVEQSLHLLNLLGLSNQPLSFEIIASKESIHVTFTAVRDDAFRLSTQLKGTFPTAIIQEVNYLDFPFNKDDEIAIADLGLAEESMRSIAHTSSFQIDPLASILASLEHLHHGEVIMFQTIFKGVTAPWSKNMQYAVSSQDGSSFFQDEPKMPQITHNKTSTPLFATVMRIAVQSSEKERSRMLSKELLRNISISSESEHNRLIPLSNEGYDYDQHVLNLFYRQSNRWGMLLSSREIATFVHYPNATVVSQKLRGHQFKTKRLPSVCISQKYAIGINEHENEKTDVSINDEQRLKHTHIIGATGVGKSTLLTHMVVEDIVAGNGCTVIDPHGDLIDDIISRIPEHRIKDTVIIDPSDTNFPIGFNLFQANSEAEEIVLSSDLITSFQKQSSSWGDVIHSILSNAINTFLSSDHGGTLIELKRFLIEPKFRASYLKKVHDPTLLYYWNHDYPMLKKGSLSPLLIRIDSFLRSKTIQLMLAQKDGFDFSQALSSNKIILCKLSQGLIGEQNAHLLGSLFLSKLYQVALGRQALSKQKRQPHYVYIDEFQHFMTDSLSKALSGARKYGLGLVLAHQDLAQIEDSKIRESVIANPNIRICFRLSDKDAKQLEHDFSSFKAEDFANLDVGQAIARVGRSSQDFSLLTHLPHSLQEIDVEEKRKRIVDQSRESFGKPRSEVEEILSSLLPHIPDAKPAKRKDVHTTDIEANTIDKESAEPEAQAILAEVDEQSFEAQKKEYVETFEKSQEEKQHRTIQNNIKELGQQYGFLSTIEKEIEGNKRIDVYLERTDMTIACEVAVTTPVNYEIENIRKSLSLATIIIVTSPNKKHLTDIKQKAEQEFSPPIQNRIHFVVTPNLESVISKYKLKKTSTEKIIKGYRVKVEESEIDHKTLDDKLKRVMGIFTKRV